MAGISSRTAAGYGGNIRAWTPRALGATCKLWLRPEAPFVTLNATDLASWNDQSGSGNDFAQGVGASQPAYNATDPDFNGHPSVQFRGTDDYLTRAQLGWLTLHLFWVGKNDADPQPGNPADSGSPFTWCADGSPEHFPLNDGNCYFGPGSSVRKSCGSPTENLASAARRIEVVSAAGLFSLTVGAETVHTTAVNTVGWAFNGIGGQPPKTYFWPGRLAEIIACDTELTGSALADVRAYLDGKYAL